MALPRAVSSALAGCDRSFKVRWDEKAKLRLVVIHLTLCDKHEGGHHFAVIGDGLELWYSEEAALCIADVLLR